jgi:carboxyl-terminal processing protease
MNIIRKLWIPCCVVLLGLSSIEIFNQGFFHQLVAEHRSFSPHLGLALANSKDSTKDPKESKSGLDQESYNLIRDFMAVLSFVETNYVDPTNRKTLIMGAIKGMLETLDPHSHALSADEYKDMQIDTSGQFGGIGIEIGMKDNILTIMSAIEGTPAAEAKLEKGDRITRINSKSTLSMTLGQAVSKMRGKVDTDVVLTIFRESFKTRTREQDFKITRKIIKIKPVKSELLEPAFGYARLTTFNEHASSDLKSAIDALGKKQKLKGLVLDLRNNPGGLLDQAVEVAGLFLQDGIVVSTIGRDPNLKEVRQLSKAGPFKDFPIAILVNASTASAAEIVAGALQDHKRALILGQPTFGKGSVQTVTPLTPDIAIKLTTARYYTPSGVSIQEKGVQPDILLDRYDIKALSAAKIQGDSFREKDLRGHMLNPDSKSDDSSDNDNGDKDDEKSDDTKEQQDKAIKNKIKQLTKGKDKNNTSDPTDDDEPSIYVFDPKEDLEVKEALLTIKARLLGSQK